MILKSHRRLCPKHIRLKILYNGGLCYQRCQNLWSCYRKYVSWMWAAIVQLVQPLDTGWTVRRSNPCRDEMSRTRPDRPRGPHSLLYNPHRLSCPGVKRPERGIKHPTPSNTEVKERVELFLYYRFWPSWPVVGLTLPILLQLNNQLTYSITLTKHLALFETKVTSAETNIFFHVYYVQESVYLGILTTAGAEQSEVRFKAGARNQSLHQIFQTCSRARPVSYSKSRVIS